MYGIIYRAFLESDGRSYIGQTIIKFEKRKIGHKTVANKNPKYHFHKAINKYGFDNFKWEILQECNSREELNAAEIDWISKFDSIRNGFNECSGGRQSGMPEKSRKKMSEDRKGEGNPNYGKSTSVRGKGNLYAENIPSKFKEGNIPWNKGKKYNKFNQLTFEKAQEIRELYENGELIRIICEKFSCKPNTVYNIVANRIWKQDKKQKLEEIKTMVRQMYKSGIKRSQIVKDLNITLTKVYNYTKDL